MKKIFVIFICLVVIFSFSACTNKVKFTETEDKTIVAIAGTEYTFGGYSHIKVEDIDSLENGLYESNEVLVELTQAKRPKPKGWFQGFYQADNVMVELSPKKSE